MRDYSFGNFISVLREQRGLSQYQLGALVGVSDKAVSKWKNGVSKPRMNVIRKLAEVLDVGIDELLTCEYITFKNKRKDLFAMDRNIIKKAEERMKTLYGENPPIYIANRFKTEELMLERSENLQWMGFFGYLREQLYEKGAFFLVRDAQMGASFLAWLLGGTNVNPLPAHYYCPACRKIEFVSTAKCGLDLPDKKCSCGEFFEKDGFHIDAIHMYPLRNENEIYISGHTKELVKDSLKKYFEGYGEMCEVKIIEDETQDSLDVARYIIFTEEREKKPAQDSITLHFEEYYDKYLGYPKLIVVENPAESLSFKDLANIRIAPEKIVSYAKYAAKNGQFKSFTGEDDLNGIVAALSNPKFSDLLAVSGLLHGTGVWKGNGEELFSKGIPLDNLITNREDVYAYLYDKVKEHCCDNPFGQIYEIKENVRKGKYFGSCMTAETEQLLLECDVPAWYVESMKKIRYLFPKGNLIAFLKKDLCEYIKMNKKELHKAQ